MGLAAGPGGRPGRFRPRDATGRLRLPHLPRARRGLVPRRRPAEPARHVPRCEPRRLGPEREELPPVHHRDRRADPARHRIRDGHHQGRRRRRGDRVLRRRRLQPGRCQRGLHLRLGLQLAGGLLLPEQPVGDLRAHHHPDQDPAVPPGLGLRLPGHPGRRQRRAGLPRGDPLGPGARPYRQRPGADRGLHLPDGRAHHLRRPDPLPGGRRDRGLEGQGPDHPAPHPPGEGGPGRRGVLRLDRGRERAARAAGARGRAQHAGSRPHPDLRPRLRGAARAGR